MAEVKQKLPKHIIALKNLGTLGGFLLFNKKTNLHHWCSMDNLVRAVESLEKGRGSACKEVRGKQIVF